MVISSILGIFSTIYFAPLTIADEATVWFSNNGFEGWTSNGDMDVHLFAKIKSQGQDTIWLENGIEQDVFIGNVSVISLFYNIKLWSNDSLNLYKFPVVSVGDDYSGKLYSSVADVNITASMQGNHIPAPHYDGILISPEGLSLLNDTKRKTTAYVDLDEIDELLGIQGDGVYSFSILLTISYRAIFSPPLFYDNPSEVS